MSVAARLNRHLRVYSPRERLRTIAWSSRHARNTDGRPYSHSIFPHLGAPGGPADAMDDPHVRRIWLQFASRLGKTFFGQCCAMKKADEQPGPMMFASSVEKTAIEVTERTYKMIEASPRVAMQLRPPNRRRQSVIDFDACQMFIAWSRSVSTLADKEVEFGHANEIDKWEHLSTSKEADPLKLFLDRFKNRPHHKVILESTPSVKGKSRIEAGRIGSTNCQFYVPCPVCNEYQTLKMEQVKWLHNEAGRSERELARRSAYYECEACKARIDDHHRQSMMQHGVWCPAGCRVNNEAAWEAAEQNNTGERGWGGWREASWITGETRSNSDAGYQLSSLYALSLSWGDIAAEFLSCHKKPQDYRNFINQWKAETWEHVRRQETWEQVGNRLIGQLPRGVAPEWATTLTCGVDRQGSEEDRFPWVVDAWGSDKCATIAYGNAESFEDLKEGVIASEWMTADGRRLQISQTLIDSGYRPNGVYEFCRDCSKSMQRKVSPCKGSSGAIDSEYRRSVLSKNTSMPNMTLYLVDTIRTQLWVEKNIHDPASGYSIYKDGILNHQNFLEQLLNDAAVDELDSHNNLRQSWERIDTNMPNDYRDCRRYAYIAFLISNRGRPPVSARPSARDLAAKAKGR